MSEDPNKQAVVEDANAQAAPDAAAVNARDDGSDLDSILSTFDQETKKPDAVAAPTPGQKPDATLDQNALAEVRGAVNEIAAFRYTRDMESTIKSVRGNLDPEIFDDTLVEGWINAQATRDPRLTQAWNARTQNPKQFEKVVQGLSKSFGQKFSKLPDKQATEDREVVAAAVRGTSTKAPEGKAPSYGNLGNNDFADQVEKDFGFRPI